MSPKPTHFRHSYTYSYQVTSISGQ